MITSQTKDSIERIFNKAARSRLPLDASHSCTIVAHKSDASQAHSEARVVVLTISSILFRLMLLLQFEDDEATHAYFVKEGSAPGNPDHGADGMPEIFSEIANLCCGAINQELLRYFPDLGMSTPYVLNAPCIAHLENLKPDYLAAFAVTINDDVHVHATICVCAHAPIDFNADVSVEEESSGELEFF